MRPIRHVVVICCAAAITLAAASAWAADAERGKYLFDAAGCAGCHTDPKSKDALLAGGRKLDTPFGVFYSPNITPDVKTGIGAWTDDDFIGAVRRGRTPDGANLFPVFPYPSYTAISDRDLVDIKAHIFTLPAIERANRPPEVAPPFGWRPLVTFWKLLYFRQGPYAPDPHRSEAWNRGNYLVNALGHCGECHTPRDGLGGLLTNQHLAGTARGPDGDAVPNITADPAAGVGKWSDSDFDSLFTLGMLPDGDFVGGGMTEVIENTTGKWTAADRAAVITYLRTVGVPRFRQAGDSRPAH